MWYSYAREKRNDVTTYEEVRTRFADALYAKTLLLPDRMESSRPLLSHVKRSMNADLRAFGNIIFPKFRPYRISRAADDRARSLGIDLRVQSWDTQTQFDKKRAVFQYEHMLPLNMLVTSMIWTSIDTRAHIEKELDEYLIAWILKTEDHELTSLGYRKTRYFPEEAYSEAGIILLDTKEYK